MSKNKPKAKRLTTNSDQPNKFKIMVDTNPINGNKSNRNNGDLNSSFEVLKHSKTIVSAAHNEVDH